MSINCSGCGGYHPRPGGSRCKFSAKKPMISLEYDSVVDSDDEVVANPSSQVAWSALLLKSELESLPDRTDPAYMDLCERTISDLSKQVEAMSNTQKVEKAESVIANLMSKLKLGPVDSSGDGAGDGPRDKAAARDKSMGTPSRGRGDLWNGDMQRGASPNIGFSSGLKNVVEPDDNKEYLRKLRPESHLVPIKNHESMNYRELVLGMVGVHAHLLQHGRPVYGYEQHCLFVKRKSVSFLYSNLAGDLRGI